MQQEESEAKNKRRIAGTQALREWQEQRKQQIKNRTESNKVLQQERERDEVENRKSMNPWQRVCANVDFTSAATTTGGKDVSRMKSAMMARKQDLT